MKYNTKVSDCQITIKALPATTVYSAFTVKIMKNFPVNNLLYQVSFPISFITLHIYESSIGLHVYCTCQYSVKCGLHIIPRPVSWRQQSWGFCRRVARSFPPLQSSLEDEPYGTGSSFLNPSLVQTCVSVALPSLAPASFSAEVKQNLID